MAKPKIIQTQEDGWIPVNETWVYVSPNTMSCPAGAVSRFQKGDKVKWAQTTIKFGVIITVADTLITIAINTDYIVTSAAISAVSISRIENPFGFPSHFHYIAELSPQTGAFTTAPITAVYSVKGQRMLVSAEVTITNKGTAAGYTRISVPAVMIHASAGCGQEMAATGKALSLGGEMSTQSIICSMLDYTTIWVNGYVVVMQMEFLF